MDRKRSYVGQARVHGVRWRGSRIIRKGLAANRAQPSRLPNRPHRVASAFKSVPAGGDRHRIGRTSSRTLSAPALGASRCNTPTLHRIKGGTESEEGSMPVGVVKWFNDQR